MPSNINDPLIPGSKYTEYLYGTPKKEITPKNLDLNNLDLSLEDFQKMSSGKYNAGELKLTSSGKLDIVNNHKTWTMFNNTKIDAAESFAIRAAFADALEAEGISEKRMHSIRKQLGLGDDNSLRSSKAFTPLTRQEIREIIDKNIETINDGREEGDKLKTYADMHARYSEEELNGIRTERDAINRMGDNRSLLLESDLLIALRLTSAGDFSHLSEADAADYLEFIEDMRGSLEVLENDEYRFAWSHENPGRDFNESVANKLDLSIDKGKVVVESKADGKKVRISLGLTPDELRSSLDTSEEKLLAVLNLGHTKVKGKQHTSPKTDAKPLKADPPEVEEIVSRGDDNQQKKKIAQTNLNVLVRAMQEHYGNMYNLEAGEIENIIKSVDDWEDKLGACSTKGNSGTIQGLNEDLRNFLLENQSQIQPRIDEAVKDKG